MFDLDLTLPIHPITGDQALALLPSGRPIWPIHGAADDDDADDDAKPDKGGKSDKDEPDEVTKWKTLARKHEGQLKKLGIKSPEEVEELRNAARRLRELEDADKSESEKAKEEAAREKKRADEAEARLVRLEVGAEKGLTPSQARRLVGSTREELEADADELLEAFGGSKDKKGDGDERPGGLKRPDVKPRSGTVPDAEPEDNDPAKLAAMVPRN